MTLRAIQFLIDTNVILYAYDPSAGVKEQRAREVLRRLEVSATGALSVQVLGEFYVNAIRKIVPPLSHNEATRGIERLVQGWPVFELTPAIVRQAVSYVQTLQLSYWDALLIATARANGVATILSEDLNDGQVYDGVRVANPFVPGFDLALLD